MMNCVKTSKIQERALWSVLPNHCFMSRAFFSFHCNCSFISVQYYNELPVTFMGVS